MGIINFICTTCGKKLELDTNNNWCICQVCGSRFSKDQAIGLSTENNSLYELEEFVESELKNAEILLKTDAQSRMAERIYEKITECKPKDYRGWLGIVRAISHEFTKTDCTEKEFDRMNSCITNAITKADSENKNKISYTWNKYCKMINEYTTRKSEEERLQERKSKIKRNICIALSYIINVSSFMWSIIYSIMNVSTEADIITFVILLSVMFANSVLTTVMGILASTKSCSHLPALTAGSIIICTIMKLTDNFSTFAYVETFLSSLFYCVVPGVVIFLLCSVIPLYFLRYQSDSSMFSKSLYINTSNNDDYDDTYDEYDVDYDDIGEFDDTFDDDYDESDDESDDDADNDASDNNISDDDKQDNSENDETEADTEENSSVQNITYNG